MYNGLPQSLPHSCIFSLLFLPIPFECTPAFGHGDSIEKCSKSFPPQLNGSTEGEIKIHTNIHSVQVGVGQSLLSSRLQSHYVPSTASPLQHRSDPSLCSLTSTVGSLPQLIVKQETADHIQLHTPSVDPGPSRGRPLCFWVLEPDKHPTLWLRPCLYDRVCVTVQVALCRTERETLPTECDCSCPGTKAQGNNNKANKPKKRETV